MLVRPRVANLILLAAVGLLALSSPAGASPPCPEGSTSVVNYRPQDIGKCVLTTREGVIGLNQLRTYNIYCPGRMTMPQANGLATALARNDPSLPAFRTSVAEEFRRHDLVPVFGQVAHLFHYECRRGDGHGVATHLRVQLKGTRPSRVGEVAPTCRLRTMKSPVPGPNESSVGPNDRVEYDYRCTSHFTSGETRDFVWDVAAKILEANFRLAADQKYCVHADTSIQCAPCSTTDKIVIRAYVRHRDGACPRQTAREVRRVERLNISPIRR